MTEKKLQIGGIIQTKNLTMVSVHSAPDAPGMAAKLLGFLGANDISVELITEGGTIDGMADITFCFDNKYEDKVRSLTLEMGAIVNAQAEKWNENVAILAVYGPHFREKPNIAAQVCEVFGRADVNILCMSTSISTISCVIRDEDFDRALKALEESFIPPKNIPR